MRMNPAPRYLRVSLLSACNLRCSYCLPVGVRRPTVAAPDDRVRSAIRFLHHQGVRKIRFTGGEPTLCKSLVELVSFVRDLDGDIHAAITSNGVLLESRAQELSAAGLNSANISLDTLDPTRFRALTGSRCLGRVIAGIEAAAEHIGNVKLNCVLMRGVNDDEVDKLILFADRRGLDIRFIEFMPNRYSGPGDSRFISSDEIRNRLPWDLQSMTDRSNGAARYYTSSSLTIRVGFISSVSHPFCGGCDRVRLSADGFLYACLYDPGRINLFDLLATDSGQAKVEFARLVRSKQFRGPRGAVDAAAILPQFSSIGG